MVSYLSHWKVYLDIEKCQSKMRTITKLPLPLTFDTFRYTRMPFDLRNAPAKFQCALTIILSEVRWNTCPVYIDDVVVVPTNSRQYVKDIHELLTLLHKSGVTLKLPKCDFFKKN